MTDEDIDNNFSTFATPIIKFFLENYKTANQYNNTPMPRRLQLSILMTQSLLHDVDKLAQLVTAFFKYKETKEFFGINKPISLEKSIKPNLDFCILDNSGSGGNQQILTFISNILLTAVDLTVLENKQFNEKMIQVNILKSIERFKSFSRGEEVPEECLIGLSGFSVSDDLIIGFGNLTANALNNFQSTYFFGNEYTSLIIKNSFKRKLIFKGNQKEMQSFLANPQTQISNFFQKVVELTRSVRLALILTLANSNTLLYSFVEGDYLISSTGNLNSFLWKDTHLQKKISEIKIDKNIANKISIKYLTIIDNDLSSINIAINRLLSASCMRDSLDDMLIDAVMCWENIIGSEHEVTFKVCASMAKLLAQNKEESEQIFNELKKIYNNRSELIHGNTKYQTNQDYVNKAIIYAAKLMDIVILNNKLLEMENGARSNYILLH